MTLVFVFGSGECDQLGLEGVGSTVPAVLKKGRKPDIFDIGQQMPARSILKVVCGGMHTLALASDGSVWSWGCNDDGALGRMGACEVPLKIEDLKIPVDGITAGDCHSVAYCTSTNQIYLWGQYRLESTSGRRSTKYDKPERFAKDIFKNKVQIKKIASGSNHSIALSKCGKFVYGWGSAESGQNGRMISSRKRDDNNDLKPEKILAKDVVDVFCGNDHSFYINAKHAVYSWGQNNHGQLGIGNRNNTSQPTRIKELDPFEGDYIAEIDGGEHHSIARTKDGAVYCWGSNEEGQLGLGDTFGDHVREKQQIELKEQAAREANTTAVVEEQNLGEQPEEPKKQKPKEKKKTNKDDDLKNIQYFYRPILVETLYKRELDEDEQKDERKYRKKIVQVTAKGHFSYAVDDQGLEVFSWGMGMNSVLGNGKDENEYRPHHVAQKVFGELPVVMVALGTQHVVALTKESADAMIPELQYRQQEKEQSPQKVLMKNAEDQQQKLTMLQATEQASHNSQKSPIKQMSQNATNHIPNDYPAPAKEEIISLNGRNGDHNPNLNTSQQASQSKKRNIQQFQGQVPLGDPIEDAVEELPVKRLKYDDQQEQALSNSEDPSEQN